MASDEAAEFEQILLDLLDHLKRTCQLPELFIEAYFSELKSDVDLAAEKRLAEAIPEAQVKINLFRSQMIDLISSVQQSCQATTLDTCDSRLDVLMEKVQAIKGMATDSGAFRDQYLTIAEQLMKETDDMKEKILSGQSLAFVENKGEPSSSFFGALVHLKDIYLNRIQVEAIRYCVLTSAID